MTAISQIRSLQALHTHPGDERVSVDELLATSRRSQHTAWVLHRRESSRGSMRSERFEPFFFSIFCNGDLLCYANLTPRLSRRCGAEFGLAQRCNARPHTSPVDGRARGPTRIEFCNGSRCLTSYLTLLLSLCAAKGTQFPIPRDAVNRGAHALSRSAQCGSSPSRRRR